MMSGHNSQGEQMNNDPGSYFSGQHAVITGGASGIGEAIAERLAETGMRITLMGRNPERLSATASRLKAASCQVDVTDPESVRQGFAAAVQAHGPISILINNAGSAESSPFTKMGDELWDRMLAVNLTGTYLCTRTVVSKMSKAGFGRIVNIASTAAQKGYALTRALALEMARKGVTVNAVCPGFTDTDLVARSLDTIVESTGMTREQALAELVKNNPQGRLIRPQEVAETVIWLCGENSASITGQAIAVAGGEV